MDFIVRTEQTSLHLAWREYHVPVKTVVDEDLCEMFAKLPPAREQDRSVGEGLKKLDQLPVTASGF